MQTKVIIIVMAIGITVSGANHRHNARAFSLQPSVASTAITLGSGQSYQIGYRTSDSGSTNQAMLDSGNLSIAEEQLVLL